MASEEHQNLAHIIKSVHKKLRDDTKQFGEKRAWEQHLEDATILETYSGAMHKLATTYWEASRSKTKRPKYSKEPHCRIEWSVKFCSEYFEGGDCSQLLIQRHRESRVLKAMKDAEEAIDASNFGHFEHHSKLRLLDVGSCYNPFSKFEQFDVLAIDIAPATQLVRQCDFLSVEIIDEVPSALSSTTGHLLQLSKCTFDVIVFSLLLEYLPTSPQRMQSCQNAYDLLQPEGVLIIITPDSKHVGCNAKLIKNWRYSLSLMGFSRIRVEKLQHLTCMVFRKAINASVAYRWARIHKEDYMTNTINIPQDFTTTSEECGIPDDSYT